MGADSLLDRSEHPQSFVPPGAKDTVGLDVFLFVVRPLVLALVERMLQTNIRPHLALCSFQSNEACDVERRLDLNLYDMLSQALPRGDRREGRLTCSGRSHCISPVRSKT